jgi:hypothetical protein
MYVQENKRSTSYHTMPKSVSPKVTETNEFLDKFHGVDTEQHEVNPDWRKTNLSQPELLILATSTNKGFAEFGLSRSPSNYAEVMRLNQQVVDEQCKIARNRNLPMVLERVSPDVIKMAKARLSKL